MDEITLAAERRGERGSSSARRLRREGQVPGVVYGLHDDAVAITVPRRALAHALSRGGPNAIVALAIDGDSQLTMTKEVQRDPVHGELLHVDFVRVRADVAVTADVPVHLVGDPAGARDGGVLEHQLSAVTISALPGNMPQLLEGDVSGLGIGDHLCVRDLVIPPGAEVLTDPDEIVAMVAAPRVVAEAVPAEEAAVGAAEAPAGAAGAEAKPEASGAEVSGEG